MNNITILAIAEAVVFAIIAIVCFLWGNRKAKDADRINGMYDELRAEYRVCTVAYPKIWDSKWAAEVRKQTDLFQEEQSKVKDRDATIVLLREEREKLSNASMSTIYDLQKELADTESARLHLENMCKGQASTINKMLPLKKENEALIDIVVELLQCLPEIESEIKPEIETETKPEMDTKYKFIELKNTETAIHCESEDEAYRIIEGLGYNRYLVGMPYIFKECAPNFCVGCLNENGATVRTHYANYNWKIISSKYVS